MSTVFDTIPNCEILVPLEEALVRLSAADPLEVAFECRPNTGVTHCASLQRIGVVEMLSGSSTRIRESGLLAQVKDFGLNVPFIHKVHGFGTLFVATKPECRLNALQLEESQKRGGAAHLFSTPCNAGEVLCPACLGKGEIRRFVMYVGCITNGCGTCQGSGRIKK